MRSAFRIDPRQCYEGGLDLVDMFPVAQQNRLAPADNDRIVDDAIAARATSPVAAQWTIRSIEVI